MRQALLAGAFACALSVAPGIALAQDGIPFHTFGVPAISGTIGNTSLYGEKTIKLDTSGLLTVKDGRGTHTYSLTNADAQSLVNLANGADLKDVPPTIRQSAMIMGATSFDLKISTADGKSYERQGSAIQDLGRYPGFEKLVEAVDALVVKTANIPPANPVDPVKKTDKFDKIDIETENPWTRWTDHLTVNPDGTYTFYKSGPDVLAPETGKLTPSQLAALEKSFNADTFKANDGKTIGGILPDDSLSTIKATVGGKTYTVSAYADSKKLGPLAGLEKALQGDMNGLDPAVAHPLAGNDGGSQKSDRGFFSPVTDFLGGVGDMVSGWFGGKKSAPAAKPASDSVDSVRGVRATGMTDVLGADIKGATDSADGKDVGDR